MVRIYQWLMAGLGLMALMGCEGYSGNSPFQGSHDSYVIEDWCLDFPDECGDLANQDYLRLQINHSAPIYVVYTNGHNFFDVAGFCNTAGYSANTIRYKILNGQDGEVSRCADDATNKPDNIAYRCVNGRFQLSISSALLSSTETRTLVIWLVGIDKTECKNPDAVDRTQYRCTNSANQAGEYECFNPSTAEQSIEVHLHKF
jgi:hypothetical protein